MFKYNCISEFYNNDDSYDELINWIYDKTMLDSEISNVYIVLTPDNIQDIIIYGVPFYEKTMIYNNCQYYIEYSRYDIIKNVNFKKQFINQMKLCFKKTAILRKQYEIEHDFK